MDIRHQRIELHCSWQNGRIERFLDTLKQKLNRWAVDNREQLQESLRLFRVWYNHIQPHQHLQGRTLAETWADINISEQAPKESLWFDAWNGLLTDYYLQR